MTMTEPDTAALAAPTGSPPDDVEGIEQVRDVTIAALEAQFHPVTRTEAIARIMTESGCGETEASAMYSFHLEAAMYAVSKGRPSVEAHLAGMHLLSFHDTMDIVMPDEQTAVRGSGTGHDLLERAVSEEIGVPVTFVHTKGGTQASYCATLVTVRRGS